MSIIYLITQLLSLIYVNISERRTMPYHLQAIMFSDVTSVTSMFSMASFSSYVESCILYLSLL